MGGEWICLMVDGTFRHGDREAVDREIASIFGQDLIDARTVCNEEMSGSTGEYYLFLKCGNYDDHLERLKKSAVVVSVIPSYENPHRFNDNEVDEFAGSVEEPKKPGELDEGDMVRVTEGYLKNLYGVVERKSRSGIYKVVFSFHLRRFSDILSVSCLQFVANILRREKAPAPVKTQEVYAVVQRHQLCRKLHRVHKKCPGH